MSNTILFFYYFMWYMLIVLTLSFFIFGLDSLFFDIFYYIYQTIRYFKSLKFGRLTYEQLSLCNEKKIAIIVACWNESDVIGQMLEHNVYEIDYTEYTIFVGTYPNDPATVEVVSKHGKEK